MHIAPQPIDRWQSILTACLPDKLKHPKSDQKIPSFSESPDVPTQALGHPIAEEEGLTTFGTMGLLQTNQQPSGVGIAA